MLAKTDILTGLNNRRAGLEILESTYLRCKRQRKALTVCFADIDGLKSVNDTYGHGVGDNMIRTVAAILKKQLDGSGEVCRLGGDEFLLILAGFHKPQAVLLASRIEQAISRTFVSKSQSISMSFGFKEAEYDAKETVFTLINVADSEMYREKRNKA
jgi:diguanylate cyclase (GGDEF)-like protein